MNSINNDGFDFDAWAALAEADPQAFEAQRHAAIEALIAESRPELQRRLRGLQWRLDMERRRYHHPLAACTHAFNAMWESVYGEGGLVEALNGTRAPAATATVMHLPAKASAPTSRVTTTVPTKS